MNNKPRVIKDFEKLDGEIQEKIKLSYPNGFAESLIYYQDKEGNKRTALPFETDDRYYLVRMTKDEAFQIIDDDEDFDDDGYLKDDIKEEYEDKYSDEIYFPEEKGDEDDSPDKDLEDEEPSHS